MQDWVEAVAISWAQKARKMLARGVGKESQVGKNARRELRVKSGAIEHRVLPFLRFRYYILII